MVCPLEFNKGIGHRDIRFYIYICIVTNLLAIIGAFHKVYLEGLEIMTQFVKGFLRYIFLIDKICFV